MGTEDKNSTGKNDVCTTAMCRAELNIVNKLIKKVGKVATPLIKLDSIAIDTANDTDMAKCVSLKKQCNAEKMENISEQKICGSDHVTYGRECEFLVRQCEARATGSDIIIAHQGECKECREVTIKKTEAEKNKGFAFFGLVFKMELLDMGCGTFPRKLKVQTSKYPRNE